MGLSIPFCHPNLHHPFLLPNPWQHRRQQPDRPVAVEGVRVMPGSNVDVDSFLLPAPVLVDLRPTGSACVRARLTQSDHQGQGTLPHPLGC